MTNRELAEFAKEKGYKYIATIIRQIYNTNYWNVNSVDHIIKTGKFTPAPTNGKWTVGCLTRDLPEECIQRTLLRWWYKDEKRKGKEK